MYFSVAHDLTVRPGCHTIGVTRHSPAMGITNTKKDTKMKFFNKRADFVKEMAKFGVKSETTSFGDTITLELNSVRNKLIIDYPYLEEDKNSEDKEDIAFIAGSKKFKQVVLSVSEEGRHVNRGVTINTAVVFREGKFNQTILKNLFPVNMPKGTKYSLHMHDNSGILRSVNDAASAISLAKKSFMQTNPGSSVRNKTASTASFTMQAAAPKSSQYFLVGTDENHMFISNLPKAVNSVEEAHKILIPKECVGKKYVRQGEFFFLPMTVEEQKKYLDEQESSEAQLDVSITNFNDLSDTDHSASLLISPYSNHMFRRVGMGSKNGSWAAFGWIKNPRHEPLFLSTLHRVFVNNEIPGSGDTWD